METGGHGDCMAVSGGQSGEHECGLTGKERCGVEFEVGSNQRDEAVGADSGAAFHETMSWDGSYSRSVENSRLPSTSSVALSTQGDLEGDGGGDTGDAGGDVGCNG